MGPKRVVGEREGGWWVVDAISHIGTPRSLIKGLTAGASVGEGSRKSCHGRFGSLD